MVIYRSHAIFWASSYRHILYDGIACCMFIVMADKTPGAGIETEPIPGESAGKKNLVIYYICEYGPIAELVTAGTS